jgi:hypothetical protein
VRDSFKLLASGVVVATGVVVAAFLAAKYNFNVDRFQKYLPPPSPHLEVALYIGFVLLAVGGFYLFNWVLVAWLERRAKKDRDPR